MAKGRGFWQAAKSSARAVKTNVNPQNFRGFSPQKKFFLVSALILLVAVAANIGIAVHLKKAKTSVTQVISQLGAVQSLLSDVQSSLLYKDDVGAANYFAQAQSEFSDIKNVPGGAKGTSITKLTPSSRPLQSK